MNELTKSKVLTMSSREIAQYTGKQHKHVIRDIKKLYTDLYEVGPSLDHLKNIGTYVMEGIFVDIDVRGYIQYFKLDRKHTDCLLTGYSAKARMTVIERWHELEQPTQPQLPSNYLEALEHLVSKEKLLLEQAPKVEFVNRFIESTGNKSFREVAKMLKANEREFREFLCEKGITYRLGGGWTAYANHIDAGRFHVTGGEANGHAYTTCKFTPKGIEYVAGKWIAHKEFK